MGENGLSVADALALQNRNGCNNGNGDGMFGGQGAWWVIILILFFGLGNNGWGNRNGNDNGRGGTNTVVVPTPMGGYGFGGESGYNACCTPATQQGLTDAFNFSQLDNGQRGLERGLCDGFYSVNLGISNLGSQVQQSIGQLGTQMQQGFCSSDRANLQSFNGIQSALCQGFNGIQNTLAQTNYNMKDCCCETRESIMQSNFNNQTGFNNIQTQLSSCCCDLGRGQENIKYAIAQSTCDIMANADKNTDRIINHLVQSEVDALRTELQSAQLQLSQNAQTTNIVNQLLPVAKPAYITCSPYASAFGYGCTNNLNNSNCGCNSCC